MIVATPAAKASKPITHAGIDVFTSCVKPNKIKKLPNRNVLMAGIVTDGRTESRLENRLNSDSLGHWYGVASSDPQRLAMARLGMVLVEVLKARQSNDCRAYFFGFISANFPRNFSMAALSTAILACASESFSFAI